MAHLDGARAVGWAQRQQFQSRQRAAVQRVQAVGPVASGHGICHHAGQATVFQHGDAGAFARKPELQGVQRTREGRVHVGLLVPKSSLSSVNVEVCRKNGVGRAGQPGPDGGFHGSRCLGCSCRTAC